MNSYYPWFQKVINFCIKAFFIFATVSSAFAFASVLNGIVKYIFVVVFLLVIFLFVTKLKDKILILIEKIINRLKRQSFKKLLLIIVLVSILLKVIYTIFFYFDSASLGGDISLYEQLAEQIIEPGLSFVTNNIYYLVGIGLHLSIFKRLSVPYHVGIYILFLIGTIINYYSFTKLIGKEKAFLVIFIYLIMPSTCLLTFCITHELLGYFYFSIILYLLNLFFNSKDLKKELIFGILLLIFICLNSCISPMGKIWFIVLSILILLTKLSNRKKAILAIVLMCSLLSSNYLTSKLENNLSSQSNNVEQLLIGCNLESMGRHTDGRGKQAAKAYWSSQGVELTADNLVEGETGALKQEYLNLLTHPVKLIELLANKFYTAWSGDFYSIEMAFEAGSINSISFYIMTIMSTMLWMIIMATPVIFDNKEESKIDINTYKLVILGVCAVLLIVEISNKYSCYMTLFIYFVSLSLLKVCTNDR